LSVPVYDYTKWFCLLHLFKSLGTMVKCYNYYCYNHWHWHWQQLCI